MAPAGLAGGIGMMNPVQQMQQMQLQQMLIQNQNSANSVTQSALTNSYQNSLPNYSGNSAHVNSTQELLASFANLIGGKPPQGSTPGKPEIEDLTLGPCLFCDGSHDTKNCDRMIKARRVYKDEAKEKNSAQRLKRLADAKAKAEAAEG